MNTTKEYQSIVKVCLFALVILTPLLYLNIFLFPYTLTKIILIYLLIEIGAVAYLIDIYKNPANRPNFTWFSGILLLFLAVQLVAAYLGENFLISFFGSANSFEGVLLLAHLYLFFLMIGGLVKNTNLYKILITTSAITSTAVALIAFFQFITTQNLSATTGNTLYTVYYLAFNIFILLSLTFSSHKKSMKYLWISLTLVHLLVIFLSGIRGVMLGTLAGFLLVAITSLFKGKVDARAKKILFSIFIIGLISYALLFTQRNQPWVKNTQTLSRITDFSFTNSTLESRTYAWQSAIDGIKERPLLGWGRESFPTVFDKYYNPKQARLYFDNVWFLHSHNIILEEFLNGGIIGGSLFLLIILAAIGIGIRSATATSSLIAGSLTMFLSAGFFELLSPAVFVMLFLILALANNEIKTQPGVPEKLTRLLSIVTIGLISISFLFATIPMIQAGANAKNILASVKTGDVSSFEESFESFSSLSSTTQIRKEAAILAEFEWEVKGDNSKIHEKLLEEIDSAIEIFPNTGKILFYKGNLLTRLGRFDQARETYKQYEKLAPTRQLPLQMLGYLEENAGNLEKAEEYFKKVVSLDTLTAPSIWRLGTFYLSHGEEEKALAQLEELKKINFDFSNTNSFSSGPIMRQYLNLALQNEKFDITYQLFQALAFKDKLNVQDYINFAVSASKSGHIEEAKGIALNIKNKFPEQAEAADEFLKTL